MGKFLKISNRGTCDRRLAELVGLTTKRRSPADAGLIGDKGSGIKWAAMAALRQGIGTSLASSDAAGPYFLTFRTEPVTVAGQVAQRIFLRIHVPEGAGSRVESDIPTSLTTAAFPDWDKPIGTDGRAEFKILREFICNAYDQDLDFRISEVDQPTFAAPGETAIYLTLPERFRPLLDQPERYLKFRTAAKPVYENGLGRLWPRSQPGMCRHFVRGVLVDCRNHLFDSALYEYDLLDKTLLSEERVLASEYAFEEGVAKLFAELTSAEIARLVMKGVESGQAAFERRVLGRLARRDLTAAAKNLWLAAVREIYGARLCLPSENTGVNEDVRQIYKYRVVGSADYALQDFLRMLGLPSADGVMPDILDPNGFAPVRFEDLDQLSRCRFLIAFRMFAAAFPERSQLPIFLYWPRDERLKRLAGFAGRPNRVFGEICMATVSLTEAVDLETILTTLVHESRHCATRAGDIDRQFVLQADFDIVRLLLADVRRQIRDSGFPSPFDETGPRPIFAGPER